ncbi:MAG: thioredoxin-disulfide reductase [Candidatus Omnitrophota bacterium]|jgi:thioredoxin reductase (NADPH)
MDDLHDIVIIGGGPGGITAGLYASRARMKTLLIEKSLCGGQVLVTDMIENFPGFPEGIKGPDLADWMVKQAVRFGLEIMISDAVGIGLKKEEKGYFTVSLSDCRVIKALSLIIATGARWNSLGIPGEAEFRGRGVSYCATCDGPLFRNKDIVVVGGGDTALEDALFLTKFARSVTIVHRRGKLRATAILQERARTNNKIKFQLNSTASEVIGDTAVRGVRIKDVVTGAESVLKCDGVFIFIGIIPNSGIAKDVVKTDDRGYIICDDDMKTSVEGIFGCGDVRKKSLRQVVTATGEGATAAFSAEHYVECLKGTEYK